MWKSILEEIPDGESLVAVAPKREKKKPETKKIEPAPKPLKKEKAPSSVKKNKEKVKAPVVAPEAPKKRGRPSKEEVAAREAKKLAEENKAKQALIAKQQKAQTQQVNGEPSASSEQQEDDGRIKNFPIYLRGERVKEVCGDGRIFNGTVVRQDIGSEYVLIRWDRIGAVQWHSSRSVSRTKALPVPDDEPTEENA